MFEKALTHRWSSIAVLGALAACNRSDSDGSSAPPPVASVASATAPSPASSRSESRSPPVVAAPRSIAGRITASNGDPMKAMIVHVKSGLTAGQKPAPTKVVIDQVDKQFVPRVVPIVAGSTIEFKNSDAILHNVYSRSGVKTFDLGVYSNKEQKSAVFENVGRVDVFCAIHTNMHAIIYVTDNPYFATTDAHGDYAIKDVPPGKYVVGVWGEATTEREESVEVSADKPTQLDVKLSEALAP